MDEMTKAREWLRMESTQIRYRTEPVGLDAMLAEYGAHCAAEARAERDALALQVADLRAAVAEGLKFVSQMGGNPQSPGCQIYSKSPYDKGMVAGRITAVDHMQRIMAPALAAPTAPAVARVAAAVALAEAVYAYEIAPAPALIDEVWDRRILLEEAKGAYRAAKEADHG